MVVDLGILRREIEKVREILDHRFLDEIADLGPATLENLCAFIGKRLGDSLSNVVVICVKRPASGDSCTLYID